MADESSFDIISKPDMAEVKNALQQVEREIESRYDFKDSISEVKLEGEKLVLKSDDEYRLASLVDVLQSKLIKRGVDIKFLDYGKVEAATKMTVRQEVTIKTGIPTDKAKQIVKLIKDKGWKVTTQIQDQQIRVASKSKDDLQQVIAFLKTGPIEDVPLQFSNYR
jgi:cyclic-di-GMP-binding protein